MRFKAITAGLALAAFVSTVGAAQTMPPPAPGSTRAQPVRVSVTIQFSTPIPVGTAPDAQVPQLEGIRKRVYQTSASECAILTEIFKSECRMVSLNVSNSVQNRGNGGDAINASGNAVYELIAR